jgi:hypothetical protein
VATFGTFTLLYSVTEVFILPKIHQASFFRALLDLALPFMVAYLLLFYIIFGKGFPYSRKPYLTVLIRVHLQRFCRIVSVSPVWYCSRIRDSPLAPQFCRQTVL